MEWETGPSSHDLVTVVTVVIPSEQLDISTMNPRLSLVAKRFTCHHPYVCAFLFVAKSYQIHVCSIITSLCIMYTHNSATVLDG